MKRIGIFCALSLGLTLLVFGGGLGWLFTRPPSFTLNGVESRALSKRGPFSVRDFSATLVDSSRATPRNGSFAGANHRKLKTSVWYPEPFNAEAAEFDANTAAPFPLVIYSHGFMSMRSEGKYLAEFLASHGYIVIAANYPLTNYFSPGGPAFVDLVNQPGDVRFLIDTALDWNEDPDHALHELVDVQRIAVAGLSLGGLTSTLAAYHPTLRDPRIAASVSIAGPAAMFGPQFFESSSVPFLMIAGNIDAIVNYDLNARPVLERAPLSTLITIAGATHVGFSDLANPFFQPLANADSIGCANVKKHLPRDSSFLRPLGGAESGMLDTPHLKKPCASPTLPVAMKPDHQQALTKLAVLSFFESHFARNAEQREKNARFLAEKLADENPTVATEFPVSVTH